MDHADCDNGESVKWHAYDNSMEINPMRASTKCKISLNQQEPNYQYGTGVYNKYLNYYDGRLYLNGKRTRSIYPAYPFGQENMQGTDFTSSGNYSGEVFGYAIPSSGWTNVNGEASGTTFAPIYSGLTNYSFSSSIPSGKTLFIELRYAGNVNFTNVDTITGFKFKIGSNYYTIDQMISNNYIEPLVIVSDTGRTRFGTVETYMKDAINVLSGETVKIGNFSRLGIVVMTKASLSGYQMNSTGDALSTTYGWRALIQNTANARLTENEW